MIVLVHGAWHGAWCWDAVVFLAAFQTDEGEDMATLLMREPSALTTAFAIGPDGITVDRSRLHEADHSHR